MNFADPSDNGGKSNPYNTSAMPPPPGMTSNFVDPEKPLGTCFLVVAVVCLALSTIFTLLRVYTKLFVIKEILLEDLSLVLSWIGLGAWYGLNLALPSNGRHLWDVTLADEMKYAQTLNVILILFAPVSFFAKYTIFAQLKRIFTRSRNLIWWLIELSTWFNLILYAIFMFLGIFQCWPRSKIGNPLAQGTCLKFEVLVIPPTIIILLSDIWMGMLPILIVWKLQIALQRKYAIVGAFAMGMVSLAATVLQLYFSVRLSGTHDLTYEAYPIALFAGVQMASLVVAAALPTMPHLWLSLRGIAMQESEPSPLGRMPSRQENRNYRQDWQHDQTKDLERTISIESLVRPETPYEIFTTREVRVTSIHLNQKGLA